MANLYHSDDYNYILHLTQEEYERLVVFMSDFKHHIAMYPVLARIAEALKRR